MLSNIPILALRQPATAITGFTLHYAGTSTVLATVIPDDTWAGMYRVHWPGGTISDMCNLSRARDAAFTAAARGRDWQRLKWQKSPIGQAHRSPPVRFPEHEYQSRLSLPEIESVS